MSPRRHPLRFLAILICSWLLILQLQISSSSSSSDHEDDEDDNDDELLNNNLQQQFQLKFQQIQQLRELAYTASSNNPQSWQTAWERILTIDPFNVEAHVNLGWSLIHSPLATEQERGFTLLQDAFDESKMRPCLMDMENPEKFRMAATIGRYRAQMNEYGVAKKFMKLALDIGKKDQQRLKEGSSGNDTANENSTAGNGNASSKHGDLCIQMQLATMFDYFPSSTKGADAAVKIKMKYANQLLSTQNWTIDDEYVSNMFPGAEPDPYVHCRLQLFYLSFYYRANVAEVASKSYELARGGWPELNSSAEFVKEYDLIQDHSCIRRKIRLAVIAGVITEGHSNSESFGGMLSRLDRNIFEVTYVLLVEQGYKDIALFTKTHPNDRIHIMSQDKTVDERNGAWTTRLGKEIESWQMDIIFYFELTMSSIAQRLGMQRLAPVQINSIGHPITSGIDRSVVQYYISWGAAELPLEIAQTHYTEELKLLPSDIIYQYYERRVLPGEVSRMDGQSFGQLNRSSLGLPSDGRIYICMQKPFKFHPEVDTLFCGIMMKDTKARVVLHREKSKANQLVFERRLKTAGCDLSRITFMEQQPHHRLLALYRESTVVLDSYPAGGDTTTREVIEMGKPLVTLPARLLGGRWTLGYLSNIGLKESTKRALIASSEEEYIHFAVRLAMNDTLREDVEADLRSCSSNLFERQEAVVAWQNMFLEISPYKQCQGFQAEEETRDEL